MMEEETVRVQEQRSARVELGHLILSARRTFSDRVKLVVGRPGLSNAEKELYVGDAVLFETPDEGILEVRVLSTAGTEAEILVTRVSPNPGIAGGLVDTDPSNRPFTSDEVARIRASLESIGQGMAARVDIRPEQLDLISRKLHEIQEASERLGRKDWIMFTAGTLTSIGVAAAFTPAVFKALLAATNAALTWLWAGGLKLLS